jgi:curved DNA-binding protein
MEFKDYYKILGVADDADTKTIKTAYRKLARKYHPDVSKESAAEERFKEVTEAYEVLKSTEKRAEYDELRRYGQGGQFRPPPGWEGGRSAGAGAQETFYEGDFSEFFDSIFGGRGGGFQQRQGPMPRRGQDIETQLPVFLEDTLSEDQKSIDYELPQIDAQGRQRIVRKTLKVRIPAGVGDGERIRLKGQGGPGMGGGENGDLYLIIRLVPHPLYDVEGHNLIITVPVAPWEAALGSKITLPTLDGEIRLSIPAGSQTGQRLRIKGRGLPTKSGRADLYAVLKVVMPDKINDSIRRHWEELAQSASFDPRAEWQSPGGKRS